MLEVITLDRIACKLQLCLRITWVSRWREGKRHYVLCSYMKSTARRAIECSGERVYQGVVNGVTFWKWCKGKEEKYVFGGGI